MTGSSGSRRAGLGSRDSLSPAVHLLADATSLYSGEASVPVKRGWRARRGLEASCAAVSDR